MGQTINFAKRVSETGNREVPRWKRNKNENEGNWKLLIIIREKS